MYAHNKRHSSGSMMPNFFFILQLTIIALLSYMFVELAPLLNLSSIIMYGAAILVIGVIINCLEKRHTIIKRQHFC
ncbi:hypothetical protein JHD49_03905 [Sulfurimonas sp. SAG-AH-194-C21]|nr:hypothetical protein [Sulfurimonas sp. SAG-AH-194-C21]MDF1883075.1 hypothetical protein [Sulfurimonas sp. SAG-AH-194-C21]